MRDIEIVRAAEGTVVIALHGEHDLMTSDELATCLSAQIAANDLVVVDVTDAEFVDVSFVHNLLRADTLAAANGSRFILQMGTAPIVRRLIEVSGILHRLHWAGSREEALVAGAATGAPA
jgi:anti-anti-sigma factor